MDKFLQTAKDIWAAMEFAKEIEDFVSSLIVPKYIAAISGAIGIIALIKKFMKNRHHKF